MNRAINPCFGTHIRHFCPEDDFACKATGGNIYGIAQDA